MTFVQLVWANPYWRASLVLFAAAGLQPVVERFVRRRL